MITKWSLANFKSAGEPVDLDFKPLTIFAGANSSGKSSVLQSILLISQTLASNIATRSVVLNGHLVKLGQFDDLRNHFTGLNRVGIGWELKPMEETARTLTPARPDSFRSGLLEDFIDFLSSSVSLTFDVGDQGTATSLQQLQPNIAELRFSCSFKGPDREARSAELCVQRKPEAGRLASLDLLAKQPPARNAETIRSAVAYKMTLDEASHEALLAEEPSFDPQGCLFEHFLPSRVVATYQKEQALAEAILAALAGVRVPRVFRNETLPPEVASLVRSLPLPEAYQACLSGGPTRSTHHPPGALGEIFRAVRSRFPSLRQRQEQVRPHLEKAKLEIYSLICKSEAPTLGWTYVGIPDPLREIIRFTGSWFSNFVKYLGPLRDEPKPVYPLAPTADPFDVGIRGEHTAAVLDLHREREVQYFPPSDLFTQFGQGAPTTATLERAVLDWLRYLGVAAHFETRDLGNQGHQLKVKMFPEDYFHDLTHVGVGASQVMPIVVACLLAPPDTTLIFEQPELHLHPKVQTLLADFFLSIALSGKQCVIETHSEYLINRLRYRSASARGDSVASVFQLYFVEKKGSSSNFRRVDVNRFGAIPDWPEGFFDQSQMEAEEILRAATAKRKGERQQAAVKDALHKGEPALADCRSACFLPDNCYVDGPAKANQMVAGG